VPSKTEISIMLSTDLTLCDDGDDVFTGGVREAFFSSEYYNLVWGKRIGFAKVATDAQVVSYMLCLSHCNITMHYFYPRAGVLYDSTYILCCCLFVCLSVCLVTDFSAAEQPIGMTVCTMVSHCLRYIF